MVTEEEWEEVDSSESGSSDEMAGVVEMEQDSVADNNNFVSIVFLCCVWHQASPLSDENNFATNMLMSFLFGMLQVYKSA